MCITQWLEMCGEYFENLISYTKQLPFVVAWIIQEPLNTFLVSCPECTRPRVSPSYSLICILMCDISPPLQYSSVDIFVPRLSRKRGTLKLIRLSVRLSICKKKTLTWLISSEVLVIDHWYLAFMIIVKALLEVPCGDLDF